MSTQVWPLLNVPASSNWHLASIRAQPVKGQMYSIHCNLAQCCVSSRKLRGIPFKTRDCRLYPIGGFSVSTLPPLPPLGVQLWLVAATQITLLSSSSGNETMTVSRELNPSCL